MTKPHVHKTTFQTWTFILCIHTYVLFSYTDSEKCKLMSLRVRVLYEWSCVRAFHLICLYDAIRNNEISVCFVYVCPWRWTCFDEKNIFGANSWLSLRDVIDCSFGWSIICSIEDFTYVLWKSAICFRFVKMMSLLSRTIRGTSGLSSGFK